VRSFLLRPGSTEPSDAELTLPKDARAAGPLISCLMVTRGTVFPAIHAVQSFQAQSYENRELVIVCDRPDSALKAWIARLGDARIRFIGSERASLGELRNISVTEANGALIAQWDDDDLYHPERLALQIAALADGRARAVFLERWTLWWPAHRWLATSSRRIWEGSIVAWKDAMASYPAQGISEDTAMVKAMRREHVLRLIDAPLSYCYVVHGGNTCTVGHMETLFANATDRVAPGDYDAALARNSQAFPFAAWTAAADV